MHRSSLLGRIRVLYVSPRAERGDRRHYADEIAKIEAALANARSGVAVRLDKAEIRGLQELLSALLVGTYDHIVLAGHGPSFGLCKGVAEQRRQLWAAAFAEQLATICGNACVLLMGCHTSWLSRELARRGLRGVSFDAAVPGGATSAFLYGYFAAIASGRSWETAFDVGCTSMAYDYHEHIPMTRSFGPAFDPEQGHYYEWLEHLTLIGDDDLDLDLEPQE